MRKLLIAAAVTAAALVVAAVALGATVHNYKQTFSQNTPTDWWKTGKKPKLTLTKSTNAWTGTIFHSDSEDPANTANNKQPAASKEIDVEFPAGSKINNKAIPQCGASDAQVFAHPFGPGSACPSKSFLGHQYPKCHTTGPGANCSGNATVRLRFNGGGDIAARVYGYNAKNSAIILYINPNGAQPIILRPKLKVINNKPTLIVKIPILCALGTPPSCGGSGEARLHSLDLTIDKLGSKSKPFLKTPSKCPKSKKWTFKITYHYRPAKPSEPPHPTTQDSRTYKSPCK